MKIRDLNKGEYIIVYDLGTWAVSSSLFFYESISIFFNFLFHFFHISEISYLHVPWLYDGTPQVHKRNKWCVYLMENDIFPKAVR